MKKSIKIGIGAAAALTAGALAFAAPSFAGPAASWLQAHDSSEFASGHKDRGNHIEAELAATITGIPADVTNPMEASRGAYWEAFELDPSATTIPIVKPTDGGCRIGLHPQRNDDGSMTDPTITASALTSSIELHADSANSTKVFALYPSDGSDAVLVTVTVDADGVATATSSSELTVAYSATVAAESPEFGGGEHGHRGHGGRGHHGAEDGNVFTPDESSIEVTPNA